MHCFCFNMFKEPYEYLASKLKKPPNDSFVIAAVSWLTILSVFALVMLRCFWRIYKFKFGVFPLTAPSPQHRHTVLAGNSIPQDTKFTSAYLDPDCQTFIIDNSANISICNYKSLFVGDLVPSNCFIQTVNTPGVSMHGHLSLVAIKITWHADSGDKHEFLFEYVVYAPDSPFNILVICKLGDHF